VSGNIKSPKKKKKFQKSESYFSQHIPIITKWRHTFAGNGGGRGEAGHLFPLNLEGRVIKLERNQNILTSKIKIMLIFFSPNILRKSAKNDFNVSS
jgi:hypothetical protein